MRVPLHERRAAAVGFIRDGGFDGGARASLLAVSRCGRRMFGLRRRAQCGRRPLRPRQPSPRALRRRASPPRDERHPRARDRPSADLASVSASRRHLHGGLRLTAWPRVRRRTCSEGSRGARAPAHSPSRPRAPSPTGRSTSGLGRGSRRRGLPKSRVERCVDLRRALGHDGSPKANAGEASGAQRRRGRAAPHKGSSKRKRLGSLAHEPLSFVGAEGLEPPTSTV